MDRLGADTGADHNQPRPAKKPESTTVLPSRTGQGWPPPSSRGFGTDQACGLRREVHAAHSTYRGFRPTGQGAHADGTEPAAGTGLVSRDGSTLRDTLEAWAKRARWTVRWEPQDLNYPIEAPLTFHGSFEDAVSELFPCDAAERPFPPAARSP